MARRLNKQRAGIEQLIRMIEGGKYGRLDQKIRAGIEKINEFQIGYDFSTQERAEFVNFLKSSMENNNYDELCRLLKRKLDSIAMEAEIATASESHHISPRELVEVITKAATQLQQQVVQQQIEKIEKIQQVIEEEGATILRTKREAEDEKQEEIRLLLMLLVLWFLLCYCSVPWCVDVDLTFGLSLALSDIVLLLGGDIEKNPGPLTGTWACTMMIRSSSIIIVCFLSRRRVGKSELEVFV